MKKSSDMRISDWSSDACSSDLREHVLDRFWRTLPRHFLIDDQQRLVGGRIEIRLRRHNLPPEEQAEAHCIEIGTLEGFGSEMVPECMQESGVDPVFLGAGAAPSGQIGRAHD